MILPILKKPFSQNRERLFYFKTIDMKITLRSKTVADSRNMAGARSLFRASGMNDEQLGKPVIAIANSFSQFVPGHAHLHEAGQLVKSIIEEHGCFAAEFDTIAICDGIAMGHEGMLYSLPSRDMIADSVEYMCNAHMADALVCISNCDKVTPGMLMAAARLNIPTIFVSGGPMEAGNYKGKRMDLVDVMVNAADKNVSNEELELLEKSACPGCGSCSGMFTANSMNCLTEALGMALPGNGTILATHKNRLRLFEDAAKIIVNNAKAYYENSDESVLPRAIMTKKAFMNAMTLDIAMGGSTNTVLHLLAIAHEAKVDFYMKDFDELSRKTPCICKVAPSSRFHIEDVNRAGGIMSLLGELEKANLLDTTVKRVSSLTLAEEISHYDISRNTAINKAFGNSRSAPLGRKNLIMGSQENYFEELDTDRSNGCIRDIAHAYHNDGGLAVLFGNIAQDGCIVKTAGVDESILKFKGSAKIFESEDSASQGILNGLVNEGDVVVIRYEGPKGGPGMQEMLYPTSYLKSMNLDKKCALITDGRFSGGTSGLSIGHVSPEAAAKGEIAILKDGDIIEINIPERSLNVILSEDEITKRLNEENLLGEFSFKPKQRKRNISTALQIYAKHVTSPDKGAVRVL